MQGIFTDVVFISDSERSFVDKKSGELKPYYRAVFAQNGTVVEMNIDESIYGQMLELHKYTLDVEISLYQGSFRCKVIGFAECD